MNKVYFITANNIKMHLQNFYAETMINGGCSYNLETGEFNPNEGYFVSLPNKELKVSIERFNPEIVRNFIMSNIEILTNVPDMFVGSWVDDGKVYLDVSQKIFSKEDALRKGILANQLAIYDANKGEVINLPTPQKSGTLYQQQTYLNMKIRELL